MRERKSLGKMMRSLLLCLTLYCSLVYANISDALDYAALDKEFLFGASTASYQIEGAVNKGERGKTIWDVFSHIKNKTYHGDTGDDADKSYDLYAEDVKLLQQLNVQSYRFSIAWSRIITEDGEVNEAGVAHYVRILQLLRTANIKPVVTLYHWDLPVQFSTMSADSQSHYRGWLDRSIVDPFVLYAKVCFERFSPYVFRWITFNEPWSFCHLGYGEGVHAPGRCSDRAKCPEGDSATEQYLCGHNVLLAHAYTVQLYRENAARFNPSGSTQIGMTINIDYTYANSTKAEDIEAAQRFLEFLGGWFADPLYFGRYPDSMRARVGSRLPEFSAEEQQLLIGSNDYFGLNHYSSKWVEDIPRGGKDSRDSNTDSSRGSGSSSGAGTANPRTSDDDDSSTNAYYVGNADAGEDNADPWMRDSGCNTFQTRPSGEVIGKAGASDWLKAVPSGFEGVLVWVSERYGHPPIVVTENGCDVIGESSTPLPQVLEDDFRVEYYSSYLRAMVAAVKEKGVNMQGYYAWSLLDNYEWAEGYSKRFGLYYVDYSSSERIRHAKKSVGWYANMVQGFRDYLDNAAVAAPAQPLESEDASTVRGASELAPTEATPVVTTSSITVASRSIKTQLESDSGSQPDFPRPDWAGDSEAEDGDGNTAREKVGDDSEGDNVNDDGNDNHTDDETDDGDGDGDGGGDGDDDGTGKHSTQNPGVNSEAHSHDVLVKLTVCVYIVICLIFTLVCYVLLRKFSLRNLNRLMGDATHKHSRWESLDRNGKYHRKRNSSYNYRQYSSSSSSSSGASYQAHAYAQTGYEYGYANDDTSAQNLLTSNFQSQLPLDYQ